MLPAAPPPPLGRGRYRYRPRSPPPWGGGSGSGSGPNPSLSYSFSPPASPAATFPAGEGGGGGAVLDPYRTLAVRRDATDAEILAAYRRLGLLHHPRRRRGGGDDAPGAYGDDGAGAAARAQGHGRTDGGSDPEAAFVAVSAAYQTLIAPGYRSRYDRWERGGAAGGRPAGTPNPGLGPSSSSFTSFPSSSSSPLSIGLDGMAMAALSSFELSPESSAEGGGRQIGVPGRDRTGRDGADPDDGADESEADPAPGWLTCGCADDGDGGGSVGGGGGLGRAGEASSSHLPPPAPLHAGPAHLPEPAAPSPRRTLIVSVSSSTLNDGTDRCTWAVTPHSNRSGVTLQEWHRGGRRGSGSWGGGKGGLRSSAALPPPPSPMRPGGGGQPHQHSHFPYPRRRPPSAGSRYRSDQDDDSDYDVGKEALDALLLNPSIDGDGGGRFSFGGLGGARRPGEGEGGGGAGPGPGLGPGPGPAGGYAGGIPTPRGGGRHYTSAQTDLLFGGPLAPLYRARNFVPFEDPYRLFDRVMGSSALDGGGAGLVPSSPAAAASTCSSPPAGHGASPESQDGSSPSAEAFLALLDVPEVAVGHPTGAAARAVTTTTIVTGGDDSSSIGEEEEEAEGGAGGEAGGAERASASPPPPGHVREGQALEEEEEKEAAKPRKVVRTTTKEVNGRRMVRTETTTINPKTGKRRTTVEVSAEAIEGKAEEEPAEEEAMFSLGGTGAAAGTIPPGISSSTSEATPLAVEPTDLEEFIDQFSEMFSCCAFY